MVSILSNPVLVWLGKISYCFYSFQVLVIRLLEDNQKYLIEISPMFNNNRFILCLAFVLLLLLSAAGYYLIEEPARLKLRKYFGN